MPHNPGACTDASSTASLVTTEDSLIAGPHGPVPVRRYSPPSTAAAISTVSIVWLHGGAFLRGGLDQVESHSVAMALAEAGFPVITVAYRLVRSAPGGRGIHYPIPVDDVVAVIDEVRREAPDGIVLGGASAGACLAAATIFRSAEGGTGVRGVFFAYGIFHAALPRRAPELIRRLRGHRRFTHGPRMFGLGNLYYAGSRAAMLKPDAFAGGHALEGFPPALLIDADRDNMRASGGQFSQELVSAGVPVEYHVLAGSEHAFLNRPKDPAFVEGLRLIVEWASRQ